MHADPTRASHRNDATRFGQAPEPVHCVDCFVPVPSRRRLATISVTVASDAASWDYKQLSDIQILEAPHGRYARLICEHECGGEMFTAHCSERNFVYLEPYAEWLQRNKEDPFGVETPVIPIFFNRSGRAFLSVNGARLDHPELPAPRKQILSSPWHRPELGRKPPSTGLGWLQNLFRP